MLHFLAWLDLNILMEVTSETFNTNSSFAELRVHEHSDLMNPPGNILEDVGNYDIFIPPTLVFGVILFCKFEKHPTSTRTGSFKTLYMHVLVNTCMLSF